MEVFFAGEIKESEMMLEWAADQTTTAMDLEFFADGVEWRLRSTQPGVRPCSICMGYSGLARVKNQTTLLPTRGRTHWRRGDGYMNGTTRNILRTIISPVRCSLHELQAGIELGVQGGAIRDGIKRAGLESLVPEVKSNRLETLSEMSFRESSDSNEFDVVSSLLSGKGKWSSESRVRCFLRAIQHIFNEIAMQARTGKQTSGKGNKRRSWSMSEPSISGKGKSKENQRESKETQSENKGAKGSCKGKTLDLRQVDNEDRSWVDELANKSTQQLYKVSTPCIDDHHFKEGELKSVGELSKAMLPICFEMLLLLHVLEDLIFCGQ